MTVADYKEKLKNKILNNASNVARYILEKTVNAMNISTSTCGLLWRTFSLLKA